MSTRPNKTRVPDWRLERWHLGEADPIDSAGRPFDPSSDPHIAQQLAALRESDQEILRRYPPSEMVTQIQHRLTQPSALRSADPSPGSKIPWKWGTVLAAAGIVVVIGLVLPPPPPRVRPDPDILLKGGPQLVVVRQERQGVQPLTAGETVFPGDRLQLSYRSAGASYGVILSIDGRGAVTRHFPDTDRAAALAADGLTPLPYSYELDDAPGFERFVLITGDHPFAVIPVIRTAETLASQPAWAADPGHPLTIANDLRQTTLVLQKGEER